MRFMLPDYMRSTSIKRVYLIGMAKHFMQHAMARNLESSVAVRVRNLRPCMWHCFPAYIRI